ncbi:MAG: hypothetical protein HQL18_02695 [Candidatus Omnitrophica bacterium]|nr:hypothetical protein [Candidatus Omnitrophota bacterium]
MENASKDGMDKKTLRMLLWGAALVLSVVSLVIMFLNYKTLERAVFSAEKNAAEQAREARYYAGEYKVVKVQLDETKASLDQANKALLEVTNELQKLNGEFAGTKGELTSVQQIVDQLKLNIGMLERYKAKAKDKEQALEGMIQAFKKKNRELDAELQGVRKELATFKPDINDLAEGRSKIDLFKKQIHLVKMNMSGIKQKAYEAKVAAQVERDRLASLYGNAGFMVKDGQDKSVTKFSEKVVEIKVQFLNK